MEPALDVAVAEALLVRVAAGELGPTLRLSRPRPTVAFGRLDRLRPGFAEAVAAAARAGFTPVLRSPGGHAAAYDEGSVVFDLVLPSQRIVQGAQERFRASSAAIAAALAGLGIDARVGEVPGEYCRGEYTVNVGGRLKVVGTAQRIVRGGALLAGFVTVSGAGRLRAVLDPVYAALDLAWEPATLGETGGDIDAVERALRDALGIDPTEPDEATLALAEQLRPGHVIQEVCGVPGIQGRRRPGEFRSG